MGNDKFSRVKAGVGVVIMAGKLVLDPIDDQDALIENFAKYERSRERIEVEDRTRPIPQEPKQGASK